MRFARFLLMLVLALGAHLLLVRISPQFGGTIDLFAVLLVMTVRSMGMLPGALTGAVLGWFEDALGSSLFGLHGIAGTLAGAIVARVSQQVSLKQPLLLTAVFGLVVLFEEAVVAVLLRLLAADPPAPDPVWVTASALATALVGGLLIVFLRRSRGRWARYRLGRRPKVRFEGRRA